MWPSLLDMTKEESVQKLRNLELEAYSQLVNALRAQGDLNSDKRKLLKETSELLNIGQERYKAEIRRAISDERLTTIAYHITGANGSNDDWAQEGRRNVPLLPRLAPQTAYSAIADESADVANEVNKQLPTPAATERKRPERVPVPTVQLSAETSKPFRIPEPPKPEETKKRKIPIGAESSLAQHLLGPSKVSRISHLYRQRTKAKSKEQYHQNMPVKYKEHHELAAQRMYHQQMQLKFPPPTSPHTSLNPKINVLQNISFQMPNEKPQDAAEFAPAPSEQVENLSPRSKIVSKMMEQKVKKALPPGGQKMIVVSNAQTLVSNSILQKQLQMPYKNLPVKNIDKFKIVASNTATTVCATPTVVGTANMNSVKHKVVTVRTNTTANSKKVIPLSQLQVLNSKGGIKVLPLGGKIVGKAKPSTSSLFIMNSNNLVPFGKAENGKSSVLEDILKASGIEEDVIHEDYDAKIEEFMVRKKDVNGLDMQEQVVGEVDCGAEDVVVDGNVNVPLVDNLEQQCGLPATNLDINSEGN